MGESGHSLKIARSRLGAPRFPFEQADVGEGYAGAGPITTYFLPLEEVRRRYPTVAEKRPIQLRLRRKEAENMPKIMPENIPIQKGTPAVLGERLSIGEEAPRTEDQVPVEDAQQGPTAPPAQEARPKTRLEIALEKLTKEQYLELKKQNPGLTDKQIQRDYGIANDVFARMKHIWGLIGQPSKPTSSPSQQTEPAGPPVNNTESPKPSAGLTVAQVLKLREELEEDIESYNCIINLVELTDRVAKSLAWQRDMHQAALDRLNKAIEKTVVHL
jgi:hypothetical protein